MNTILNISAYKFVPLPDTHSLRELLLHRANALQLKGTILLAEEGINLFLAGRTWYVRGFIAQLHTDARFADIAPKESWSDRQPFQKMRVKVKNEIIRMNHPTIRPAAGRAPAVSAATVKRWLDQGHDDAGRPVVTLDTRNAFEVDAGTFAGAIDWRIRKFTEFPQALAAHQADLQGKTVVSFCTGGIRCEKAAILMQQAGLEHIYQLEGGILKYFEEVGDAHYQGGCFVFDERRAVDAELRSMGEGSSPSTHPNPGATVRAAPGHSHLPRHSTPNPHTMNAPATRPELPDHLSSDARSPHFLAAAFEHPIGIRFNDRERFDVEEYCISEGWIRVPAGKTLDRHGKPLLIKLKGRVEAFYK